MEKNVKKIKKLTAAIALGLVSSFAFAQEADDGFVVPLDEDFSKPAQQTQTLGQTVATVKETLSNSQIKQGLWIEVTSQNNSLIRNVSDGTKKGYEFDNSHFTGEFNWWFWGQINKNFQLDAEIGVLKFDKTLYQANTWGDNDPDVTWGDGLQNVTSIAFSPLKEGNDGEIGTFNKFALNFASPFVDVRFGYGDLKKNGMSNFEGIFNVIDRWNNVGDGYTELKNGAATREIGDFKIDALLALSEMRESYGTYDYLDIKYADKIEGAFTFGSTTPEEEYFYYNRTYTNAWSTYLALTPIEPLKLEGHLLKTFGSDVDTSQTLAYAGRIGWQAGTWKVRVMQSFAGENVNSVWGSDGQSYDNINADTATTQIDLEKSFETSSLDFSVGLDQGITFNDYDHLTEGRTELRTQPYADFDLNKALDKDVTVGIYGVFDFDKTSKEESDNLDKDRTYVAALNEAGLEIKAGGLFGLQKTTLDYALKNKWNSGTDDFSSKTWTGGHSYDLSRTYHSIMLNLEFNDKYSAHFGTIVRHDKDDDDTNVPFAFSVGGSIKRIPLPGKPMLWIHATYGMNPYEDNNYTLYRADDPLERATHRTYLLKSLDSNTTISQIAVGLIWDL